MASLRQANDELEQCVQERTAELLKANESLSRQITERERGEEALRESEGWFSSD
jgi:C4-dicarboxylate-specific signal transduction histidine kinase